VIKLFELSVNDEKLLHLYNFEQFRKKSLTYVIYGDNISLVAARETDTELSQRHRNIDN
jgi:hypothetical protein